ncbi:MAG: metal-dependent transcriptional regulator, partial [Clostridia bacterium]|nr:metal-dependent transcriptional regulator [Clostridia bacterium]
EFLALIGVDDQTAATDACKIEHVVSNETIIAIKNFIESGYTPKL